MNESFSDVRFSELLHAAQTRKASDVHLVPGLRPSIRVHGTMQYVDGPPVTADETSHIARRLLDDIALDQLNDRGDATSTWNDFENVIMRVHAFRAHGALTLSLRLLPRTIPSLDSLQLPKAVAALAEKQRGLVLFAGPTGSGKSTSMAALIAEINRCHARRILTIEDPIEYRHSSKQSVVVQREVGRDVRSFSDAVIGALRADPDVIMIGEMRDASTIRSAITAAETGHLVFATLHTGDAVQTVDRIVDAFSGTEQSQVRAQLAAALVAIVCQRLLRTTSGSGRRVAAEVLIATDAVRTTIREARTHQLRNLMLTGRQWGMQTLEHDLSELLRQRIIDRTLALSVSERHSELHESMASA